MKQIFSTYKLGDINLKNRIVMAPLTRGFANNKTGEVNTSIANYYANRAKFQTGLIISEGIAINNHAKGTFGVPGIFTTQQIESWKKVTQEVHKENGVIFAQLWHVGRLSHKDILSGKRPLSASNTVATGLVHKLKKTYGESLEMTENDLNTTIQDYQNAAINAIKSGFDGIEIHAAHGYLIDQFINKETNLRNDNYGGSLDNRLLFLEKVIKAVANVVPSNKISVRISEKKDDNPYFYWSNPKEVLFKIIHILNKYNIEILHLSTSDFYKPLKNSTKTLHQLARELWPYTLIGVGNIKPENSIDIIERNEVDLVAFGRPFINNPDLIPKLKNKQNIDWYNYDLNKLH